MFEVEIRIAEEESLSDRIAVMLTWLEHRRIQPETYRYTFQPAGVLFRTDFALETEALDFAEAFGGSISASKQPVAI